MKRNHSTRLLLLVFLPVLVVLEMWHFDLTTSPTHPLIEPFFHSVSIVDPVLVPTDITKMRRHLFSSDCFQFPSVEERVRFYMGGWYSLRNFNMTDACSRSMLYHLGMDHSTMLRNILLVVQGHASQFENKQYMEDVYEFLFGALSDHQEYIGSRALLTRFGDVRKQFDLPIFVKTRSASAEVDDPTEDPILAPFRFSRHFRNPIHDLETNSSDRPWNSKTNTLVWRGSSTGVPEGDEKGGLPERLKIIDEFMRTHGFTGEIEEKGLLFDIGITQFVQVQPDQEKKHQYLSKETLGYEEQLRHKYLLNIEGNDVSSGLKWMLLSNSVVFMPIPTCVSWAMEELLVPWYHYVPLREDLMDLVEKVAWCQEHDTECEQISRHATQYMYNLWTSPQAKKDQQLILQQMMERYQRFYGCSLLACQEHYQ